MISTKEQILGKDVTGFINEYKKLHENTIVVAPTSGMEKLIEYAYDSDDISRWEITVDLYNECYLLSQDRYNPYSLIQEGFIDELFDSASKYSDAKKGMI